MAFAFAVPSAHAQWQSTTYTLKGGWNAIYLHGDATHTTLDALLASHTQVVSVWRWNPNPNQVQFTSSTLIPTNGTPEWSVWNRGGSANTLLSLTGQAAYLVECTGAVTDTLSLPIVQKVVPPRSTWVRNGANLLGFPARFNSTYPTLSAYFATFPVAIATNTKIFKYAGGILGPANPIQVFDPAAEPLDRNQAYWFEAAVVSNFYAPLEVSPSNLDGLIYGRNGSLITVRVRNRTAATVTLTVTPTASAAAPALQDAITAAVPLTYRTFNPSTGQYVFTPVTAGNPVSMAIGPQSSVELAFGVDRAQITGTPDSLYASLLRFTDSGNLMDVYLPVSARVTSLSGLWIGDATVSNVSNRVAARLFTCDVTRTDGSVVTTISSRGVQSGATTLGPATLPNGTGGTLTYQWRKSNQPIAGATSANLTLTSTEMTESGAFGSSVPRSFPLRVILHVDDTGTARLLSHLFMGKLAAAPNNVGLCTLESGLKSTDKATARRFTAAHLPPDTVVATGSGSVALGQTLVRTIPLPHNAATNPYVHTYHPDHDNRNARFDGTVSAGVESPLITRAISLGFTVTPPPGSSEQGWGSSVIGGIYSETVTGIHKDPLTATGTFELRRVSELGSITTN